MAKERRVSLPIVGRETSITVPVPGGQGALTAMLPALRKISATMMSIAEEEQKKVGRKVSCRAGCSACCRQLIPVSILEAKALAVALSKMPAAKQKAIKKRFEAALAKLEEAGLLGPPGDAPRTALVSREDTDASDMWSGVNRDYFSLQIACPFLENDRCSVYEERPFVCREYLVVTDAKLCATLDPRIEPVPRAAHLTEAVSSVATEIEEIEPGAVPLVLLLEWIEARGEELSKERDPAHALDLAIERIEWNVEDVVVPLRR